MVMSRKILADEHQHFEHLRNDNPVFFSSTFGPEARTSILDRFFDVAAKCKSVVACRLEPIEKADIVALMRKLVPRSAVWLLGMAIMMWRRFVRRILVWVFEEWKGRQLWKVSTD